jgi:hypothetical protein
VNGLEKKRAPPTRRDGNAEAEELLGDALQRAEALGMRRARARGRLSLGKLYLRGAREADGRAHIAAAADEFRAMGMTTWQAQAEAALAAPSRRSRRPRA